LGGGGRGQGISGFGLGLPRDDRALWSGESEKAEAEGLFFGREAFGQPSRQPKAIGSRGPRGRPDYIFYSGGARSRLFERGKQKKKSKKNRAGGGAGPVGPSGPSTISIALLGGFRRNFGFFGCRPMGASRGGRQNKLRPMLSRAGKPEVRVRAFEHRRGGGGRRRCRLEPALAPVRGHGDSGGAKNGQIRGTRGIGARGVSSFPFFLDFFWLFWRKGAFCFVEGWGFIQADHMGYPHIRWFVRPGGADEGKEKGKL